MIVLTGTTGGLGSQVLKHLLPLLPPSQILVSLYNPSGASELVRSSGVQVRQASYKDPASLDAAWAGADKLLIVSYPSIAYDIRVRAHRNAIDAAKRLGIGHVYYTSLGFGSGLGGESKAAVMQAHLETERYLKESGMKWTIIREGIYSESWPLYLGFWGLGEGEEAVVPVGDGPVAWVSREDLGEATARIIAQGAYANESILLSGQKTYTLVEFAALISQILSTTKLQLRADSVEGYIHTHEGPGPRGDPEFLRQWATTYAGLAAGECAVVDPTIVSVLGRELKSAERTLREMLGVGGDDSLDRYAK
ncbi:NADP-binding protein [Dacryopinax primogenitus]|uniref:NADP-binding protein n=1 Tax=Dacryopinax primogenitus (strain DJM 731) TaxID=1858805 RepID=M5GBT4_DACPD|nr:NADP-binding protein [Dacryopinax primogenitus]EJU05900.1 NADP-binding protein [Dacryopinax primogenitus]